MKRLVKILLYITVLACAAYLLPIPLRLKTSTRTYYPFVYFSALRDSFMVKPSGRSPEIDGFDEKDFHRALPELFYRQLAVDGTMPDSMMGISVDASMLSLHNFNLRYKPNHYDAPMIHLYPMIESASGKVDLELPNDYFRLNDRLEFLDIDNTINEAKSVAFTQSMLDAGFVFPAKWCIGLPNPKKPFDDGWFIADHHEAIYRVMMVKGEPKVYHHTALDSLGIYRMEPVSTKDHSLYGLAFTRDHQVYAILAPDMRPALLPFKFDAGRDNLSLWGNPFYWTIAVDYPYHTHLVLSSKDQQVGRSVYAISLKDFSLHRQMDLMITPDPWERLSRLLFPFILTMDNPYSEYVKPAIIPLGWRYLYTSIPLALIAMGLLCWLNRRRVERLRDSRRGIAIRVIRILLFGIIAIPSEIVISRLKK